MSYEIITIKEHTPVFFIKFWRVNCSFRNSWKLGFSLDCLALLGTGCSFCWIPVPQFPASYGKNWVLYIFFSHYMCTMWTSWHIIVVIFFENAPNLQTRIQTVETKPVRCKMQPKKKKIKIQRTAIFIHWKLWIQHTFSRAVRETGCSPLPVSCTTCNPVWQSLPGGSLTEF